MSTTPTILPKPALSYQIVAKLFHFLVDSDATFDTGGGWNVVWKQFLWIGQAMLFPCFEALFFKAYEVVQNFWNFLEQN